MMILLKELNANVCTVHIVRTKIFIRNTALMSLIVAHWYMCICRCLSCTYRWPVCSWTNSSMYLCLYMQ